MSGYPNPHRQHSAPDPASVYPPYPPTRSPSYNSQPSHGSPYLPGGDPGLVGIEHETAPLTSHPDGFYGQQGWSSSQATLANGGRVGFADAPLLDRSGGPGGAHFLNARPSLTSQGSGRDSMMDWQERAKPLHRGATRKVKLTRKGHFVVVSNQVECEIEPEGGVRLTRSRTAATRPSPSPTCRNTPSRQRSSTASSLTTSRHPLSPDMARSLPTCAVRRAWH